MNKFQLSLRAYSIADIMRLIEYKEIIVQTKYQRRRTAWPKTAKTSLIDSVVNSFPIPPIYIRDYVNKKGKRTKDIVDGQQRISTIKEFINEGFALSRNFSNPNLAKSNYSGLPDDIQNDIADYEIPCMVIRGASEADIIKIFSRINSFSLPLNTQEKRNAKFAGEFKTLVYDLSSQHYRFWINFKILTDRKIARMKDARLISELLAVVLRGYKNLSGRKITQLYEDLDSDFPKKNIYLKNFNYIIDFIGNLLENNKIHSLFKGEALFFTLFLVLYEKCFGLPSTRKKKSKLNFYIIEERLENFVNEYRRDRFNQEVKLLFQQGTGAMKNRRRRHEIISSVIK
jgi:hypothetical protein